MPDNGDFGVEGIRYFDQFRANNPGSSVADLTYTYNVTNGVYNKLRDAGYPNNFYWAGGDAWELDLHKEEDGGLDSSMADDVDLFFIETHGRNDSGIISLVYNSNMNSWRANSNDWKLGDNWDLEWLAIYGCDTVARPGGVDITDEAFINAYYPRFSRLHLLLGAYDSMYDGWTVEEVGRDFADNLLDGDTVRYSWVDGVSDWWVDNHPAVISAETSDTWNGGSPNYSATTMENDHYHGRGTVTEDIPHDQISWFRIIWEEG
jgi:hypothetical protein